LAIFVEEKMKNSFFVSKNEEKIIFICGVVGKFFDF